MKKTQRTLVEFWATCDVCMEYLPVRLYKHWLGGRMPLCLGCAAVCVPVLAVGGKIYGPEPEATIRDRKDGYVKSHSIGRSRGSDFSPSLWLRQVKRKS